MEKYPKQKEETRKESLKRKGKGKKKSKSKY